MPDAIKEICKIHSSYQEGQMELERPINTNLAQDTSCLVLRQMRHSTLAEITVAEPTHLKFRHATLPPDTKIVLTSRPASGASSYCDPPHKGC